MRSLVTISVLGASLLNTSTAVLPQVEVSNIQPTNIQSAQTTIDISSSYDFDKSKGLDSVEDNLKNFKEQEQARYEEAQRKAAEEEARRQKEEQERLARIEADRNAAEIAAANAARAQAPAVSVPSGGLKNEAYNFIKSLGHSDDDWAKIDFIVTKESTWNPNAVNRVSGACGLAQVLPCSTAKFNTYASADYKTNWQTQLRWLINYSNTRYGSIGGAYTFWLNNGWY